MWSAAVVILLAGAAFAQGTQPKPKAAEYPVHARIGQVDFGAEYMVHSISADNSTFTAEDYLVVEVGVFPDLGAQAHIDTRNFTLRVNGKKDLLYAQAPSMVAASLRYPDWERRRSMDVYAGAGDRGVVIGRPQSVERFPGDNRPASSRLPGPVPRVPADPGGKPEKERFDPAEIVTRAALLEGITKHPVSGYVFFAYRGKMSNIKKLELLVKSESVEPVALRLR